MIEVATIGSDVLIRLDALQNASTLAYLNSATVTFKCTDSTGATVQDTTTMAYVAASNGRYEGTLTAASTNTMTANATYTVAITATQAGITLYRKLSTIAKYRSNV